MSISIRKANINDSELLAKTRVNFLCEIDSKLNEDNKRMLYENNKLYFKEHLCDDSFIAFIAFYDDILIATSGVCFYEVPPNMGAPNGRVAYIQNMYTLPQYRKQGLASRLFTLITDEAKKRNCTKITLNATDMGKPLYEKFGFKEVVGDMSFHIK
ncbi:MAG: acetyltransferase family [Clostridia bacterium]|jgi:GNAT superfamily N-acetyltransferase|nr:acetyltransferase family [Clostridia bacterium]